MRLLKRDFFLAMNRTTTTWTPFFFLMIIFFFFFCGVSLCSIVSRRQQKNTKLLKTYLSYRTHFLWVYRRDNPRGMLGGHAFGS